MTRSGWALSRRRDEPASHSARSRRSSVYAIGGPPRATTCEAPFDVVSENSTDVFPSFIASKASSRTSRALPALDEKKLKRLPSSATSLKRPSVRRGDAQRTHPERHATNGRRYASNVERIDDHPSTQHRMRRARPLVRGLSPPAARRRRPSWRRIARACGRPRSAPRGSLRTSVARAPPRRTTSDG